MLSYYYTLREWHKPNLQHRPDGGWLHRYPLGAIALRGAGYTHRLNGRHFQLYIYKLHLFERKPVARYGAKSLATLYVDVVGIEHKFVIGAEVLAVVANDIATLGNIVAKVLFQRDILVRCSKLKILYIIGIEALVIVQIRLVEVCRSREVEDIYALLVVGQNINREAGRQQLGRATN